MPGITSVCSAQGVTLPPASMRPRLNAGDHTDDAAVVEQRGHASMRPRLNAGDHGLRCLSFSLPSVGFNEAPAECRGSREPGATILEDNA